MNFGKTNLFGNEEDDGGFGERLGGKSTLANLFDDSNDKQPPKDLSYKAPTQPQQQPLQQIPNPQPQPQTQSKLIYSATIQGYRYDAQTKQYTPMGSLGAAILKQINQNTQVHQIIIYKTKQSYLVVENLTEEFKFTVQANLYVQFNSKGIAWSIRFDAEDKLEKFATNILIGKAANLNFSKLLFQDLNFVEKKTTEIDKGWKIGINFVENVIEKSLEITEINKQNKKIFVLGEEKTIVKGLEKGLKGMYKFLKRVIVVPSSLGYGSSSAGKIPANSPLLYTIILSKVGKAPTTSSSSSDTSNTSFSSSTLVAYSESPKQQPPQTQSTPTPTPTPSNDEKDNELNNLKEQYKKMQEILSNMQNQQQGQQIQPVQQQDNSQNQNQHPQNPSAPFSYAPNLSSNPNFNLPNSLPLNQQSNHPNQPYVNHPNQQNNHPNNQQNNPPNNHQQHNHQYPPQQDNSYPPYQKYSSQQQSEESFDLEKINKEHLHNTSSLIKKEVTNPLNSINKKIEKMEDLLFEIEKSVRKVSKNTQRKERSSSDDEDSQEKKSRKNEIIQLKEKVNQLQKEKKKLIVENEDLRDDLKEAKSSASTTSSSFDEKEKASFAKMIMNKLYFSLRDEIEDEDILKTILDTIKVVTTKVLN